MKKEPGIDACRTGIDRITTRNYCVPWRRLRTICGAKVEPSRAEARQFLSSCALLGSGRHGEGASTEVKSTTTKDLVLAELDRS